MRYPSYISILIEHFKKLPGVGQKSAERFAFKILDWPKDQLNAFSKALSQVSDQMHLCSNCGALSEPNRCFYCDDPSRDSSQLCVVSQARDIFSIEETHSYRGLYHVLGGLLSPLDTKSSENLILPLRKRLETLPLKEIILALDSTVEGDATLLLLKKELPLENLSVSRLAYGIPVGSTLDYVDGTTLTRALVGRRGF